MKREERDRFLTEEVMGLCWHDTGGYINPDIGKSYCIKCNKHIFSLTFNDNIIFSSWLGFGKLWEFVLEQEWLGQFIDRISRTASADIDKFQLAHMIHPERFANAVYEFCKKEKDNENNPV